MPILTEGARTAQYLVSEANGYRSRDEVVVDAASGALEPGTILGRVTATGKYVRHNKAGSGGSEIPVAILYEGIGAVEGKRTITARDAEVNGAHLVYADGSTDADKKSAATALGAVGIVVR